MKRISPALALAAGAAIAAPAFAETVTYYLWDPVTRSYVERSLERSEPLPAATVTYPYTEPGVTRYVEPSPTVTYVEPAPTVTYVEPTARADHVAPDIVVTAPRSEDEAITDEVVTRIATHPRITGTVGVETFRNDVTLTGRVSTPGQSRLAQQEAYSVAGVDEVHNLIRPRVGGTY